MIQAEGVSKWFVDKSNIFKKRLLSAVNGVSLTIAKGETLVLVGESGSGKSTFGRILARLEEPSSGSVFMGGTDIAHLRGEELRRYRRRVTVVFQNPYRSLNPRMLIGEAIAEPIRVWKIVPDAQVRDEVIRLIEAVGLPANFADRLPHQLSGGERQRIAIARALSVRPEFLIADEAVSALDVSAAAEILNLMIKLKREMGLSCLFVTHDLNVARVLADRIAVMKSGSVVEVGSPDEILSRPANPYTRLLLDARLLVRPEQGH